METFTLIAWIMMGWRIEEVQLPLLYTVQCTVFRDEMVRERAALRAECVRDPPRSPIPFEKDPVCAACGSEPGRKAYPNHS